MGCVSGKEYDGHWTFQDPRNVSESSKLAVEYNKDGPLTREEIRDRIEASEASVYFTHNDIKFSAAHLTQRGYYPEDLFKENQDSYSFYPEFNVEGEEASDHCFFAVYDGHGKDGHLVSRYTRDKLPAEIYAALNEKVYLKDGSNSLVRGVKQIARRASDTLISAGRRLSGSGSFTKDSNGNITGGERKINGEAGKILEEEEVEEAQEQMKRRQKLALESEDIHDVLRQAHIRCNDNLKKIHAYQIGHDLSGTTSVSVYMRDGVVYCSNLGDSRAILVSRDVSRNLKITALSKDQTPFRADERARVRKAGARVLSMDQLENGEPEHEKWGDVTLGETLDEDGDPPRVWHPTLPYPGTAFTRSIGDFVAETIGVNADPEIMEHKIDPARDEYIIIASDGVYEFMTNAAVANMVKQYTSPLVACRALVRNSFEEWLKYERRTDDISVIVLKIENNSDADIHDIIVTDKDIDGTTLTMPKSRTRRGSIGTRSTTEG